MTREEILNNIHHKENNLYFHFDEDEQNLFVDRFDIYIAKMNMIKNFDFSKYTDYLHESFDESLEIPFDRLRDDVVVNYEEPHKLFKNAIDFKEGYVIVKNEK